MLSSPHQIVQGYRPYPDDYEAPRAYRLFSVLRVLTVLYHPFPKSYMIRLVHRGLSSEALYGQVVFVALRLYEAVDFRY